MSALLWFRRDLRLADNPALTAAWDALTADADGSSAQGLVGLYVVDPTLWQTSGTPRRAYLRASLTALSASMSGRLVVRVGDPEQVVPQVAREVGAATVHVAESFEPFGRRRDERTARALSDDGRALVRVGSPYAVSPGRVLTRTGTPYRVFTPFRTAWLEHGWRHPAVLPEDLVWAELSSQALPPDPAGSPSTAHGRDDAGTEPGQEAVLEVPDAGEQAALARWHEFREGIEDYDEDRNRPDLDVTSRLSIALKWGEIHPRTLLDDLRGQTGSGAASFRSELAWREFHADVLWHTPTAARSSLRPVLPEDSWTPGALADSWFTAWAQGRTGYPMVDAGMRQLLAEGWMHGRTRMIVASFLVKDLHIPWQRGAQHFMDHLLDADVSQNQLNWQWVAGTGLDAAPYFRIFNPVSQGIKFDPDGDYVRRWVPELRGIPGRAVHEPWKRASLPAGYPEQMVDHARERAVTLDDYSRGKDQ